MTERKELTEEQVQRNMDRYLENEIKSETAVRQKRSKGKIWAAKQLAVNPDGIKYEVNKVTAKQAEVRQLIPESGSGSDQLLNQLIFDCDNHQSQVRKIDDNFLWGSEMGYLQRSTETLLPWPPKKKTRKRKIMTE